MILNFIQIRVMLDTIAHCYVDKTFSNIKKKFNKKKKNKINDTNIFISILLSLFLRRVINIEYRKYICKIESMEYFIKLYDFS